MLEFARYYSSSSFFIPVGAPDQSSAISPYWRHTWERAVSLELAADPSQLTFAYVLRPDGDYRHFRSVEGAWVGRTDKPETLEELNDGSGHRIGWRYTDANGRRELYNSEGRLESVIDRDGSYVSLSYSEEVSDIAPKIGLLIQVTDQSGRLLALRYDEHSRLAAISSADGSEYHYRYEDATDRLRYVDAPAGRTREYLYNEAGLAGPSNSDLLTGIVDETAQRYASFKYDSSGRVYEEWHGTGAADHVSITYDADYMAPTSAAIRVDALGAITRRQFATVNGIIKDAGLQICGNLNCSSVLAQTTRTYDLNGNVDFVTDASGAVIDYDYDNWGLETKRVEAVNRPVARTTLSVRDPVLHMVTERSILNAGGSLEAKTKWVYNNRGQETVRCELDPADPAALAFQCEDPTVPLSGAKVRRWTTTYCEQPYVAAGLCPRVGSVIETKGPREATEPGMSGEEATTNYTYYMADDATCATNGACGHRKGDLWKVTNALGHVTEYVSYDKSGRVTRTKDANGTYTDFAYHPSGWLTDRIIRASASGAAGVGDATLHIDYDATGNVIKVMQPDGAFLQYTYDDARRLIKINDNVFNSIDYCPGGVGSTDCLDAAGNRRAEWIREGDGDATNPGTVKHQLYRIFNQLGQLIEIQNAAHNPVEKSTGIGGLNIADGYDHNGNRVSADDGFNVRTEREYDSLNRLKKTIQDALGNSPESQSATTVYDYDARDNLLQVTDPEGLNTVYTYDGLNNLTELDSPDTGLAHFTYDASGNRIREIDSRGVTTAYIYDRLDRLTGVMYPTASLNIAYAYDQPNGSTGCSVSFPIGRLTRVTDAAGSTTYCYDRRGNVVKKTRVTNGVALVTEYSYTSADRLVAMTYPSGAWVGYVRDVTGRIASMAWGVSSGAKSSALVSSATYLPFGPLRALTFGDGRTQVRDYDQDYAISSISGTPSGALTLDFDVDMMGSITSASGALGSATPDRSYSYDALYRLKTSRTGGGSPLEAYTYNKTGDRLSASLNGGAASSYTYTAGTHRLASVAGVARTYDSIGNTLTGTSPGLTLGYDERNRLTSAVSSAMSATYAIGGNGERVGKTVAVGGASTTTLFGYDENGHLAGEYTDMGILQAEYFYLDDIPVAVYKGGVLYYIETDHLGVPRQIIKPSGNITVWKWDLLQNTFGNNSPNQDPDGDSTVFISRLKFPGQYEDSESNIYYNYRRDFEAGTGRYIESDPIGLKGGGATYAYAGNNPLRSVDPSGLIEWSGKFNGVSVTVGGGVALYTFSGNTTRCVNGKKGYVALVAFGGTFGLGPKWLPGSLSEGVSKFEDGTSAPDPYAFSGDFRLFSLGGAAGPIGAGVTAVQLGSAYSYSIGRQQGIDLGVSGIRGSTFILDAWTQDCDSNCDPL